VHVQDAEGDPSRRAFTRDELQALFDYADDQVGIIRGAGRKGWLAAFRDAAARKYLGWLASRGRQVSIRLGSPPTRARRRSPPCSPNWPPTG